jgi:DNA-binding Lrp family transcriptional regulator
MNFLNNQPPKQRNIKDLNEIKQLKTGRILEIINLVVNQCLYYNNYYYESEATIAKKLGIGERTVCRAVKKARELGIITRKRRINNSNIYGLNPELRRPGIIDELALVLPALRGLLCLSFLIPLTMICQPAARQSFQNNGGQYKKDVYINAGALSLYLETTKRVCRHPEAPASDSTGFQEHQEPAKRMEHHQPFKPAEFAALLAKEIEELKQKNSIQKQVQGATQFDNRSTSNGYVNEQTAREFKEFCDERLTKLIESVRKLALVPEREAEIIDRQLQCYKDRLHFKDCAKLRALGYPV